MKVDAKSLNARTITAGREDYIVLTKFNHWVDPVGLKDSTVLMYRSQHINNQLWQGALVIGVFM